MLENNQTDTPFSISPMPPPLDFYDYTKSIKYELGAIMGGIAFTGIRSWNWGSRNDFKFNDEGWFGTDRGSAGADKLGHLYASYLFSELFTKNMIKHSGNHYESAKYGALFSGGMMFFVEVLDGYSVDHGFSYEDLIMNTLGIGISYFKNTIDGLDEKLDLRLEYHPTKEYANHPITDYSGQTFFAVLKLAGFSSLKETPLKYLEILTSYHAEGFKKNDSLHYPIQKAELYVGVGLNLSELLFKPMQKEIDIPSIDYVDTLFNYLQLPYTYIQTEVNSRTLPY